MMRFVWIILVAAMLSGCAGDEKGVNQNKEKPQPAAK
jgi:hypothetical protein